MTVSGPVRELTVNERFKWGECHVCKAPHGEHCRPGIGFPLGMSADGGWPKDGAHLARLNNAPHRVREVPA